jgi:hypothetical protein
MLDTRYVGPVCHFLRFAKNNSLRFLRFAKNNSLRFLRFAKNNSLRFLRFAKNNSLRSLFVQPFALVFCAEKVLKKKTICN